MISHSSAMFDRVAWRNKTLIYFENSTRPDRSMQRMRTHPQTAGHNMRRERQQTCLRRSIVIHDTLVISFCGCKRTGIQFPIIWHVTRVRCSMHKFRQVPWQADARAHTQAHIYIGIYRAYMNTKRECIRNYCHRKPELHIMLIAIFFTTNSATTGAGITNKTDTKTFP